ncbi:MAG: PEGA domain-containing protein [Candidatus Andersenbacteria bacterium]
MNRLTRRILLIVSVLVFLAIAPAVVLYAIGYRPPTSGRIVPDPVGVLLVDAIPARAEVVVDGKQVGRLPRSVSNLVPGEVLVEITKQGYQPWNKRLAIEPARATEVRDVRLFPESPAVEQLLRDVEDFSLAPNRSLLAAVSSDRTLRVISQAGETLISPVALAGTPTEILWSPDSTLILIRYANGAHTLVDVTKKESIETVLPQLASATQTQWDPRVPGRVFYVTPGLALSSTSVLSGTTTTLVPRVASFGVSSRHLYVINQAGEFTRHTLQGQLAHSFDPLTDPVQGIAVTPAGAVSVHFADGRVGILNDDDELVDIAPHAERVSWSPDGRMLMLQTAVSELQMYNVGNERRFDIPINQLRLVVRLSRPISHPQWFAGGNHLIYQVEDEIVITEIDTRDYPATYTLDSTNTGEAHVSVGEEGETVFYVKRNGDSQNLVFAHLLTAEDR